MENIEVWQIIAFGSLGMLFLGLLIVLFWIYYQNRIKDAQIEQNYQVLKASIEVEEKLKKRLSANLHDAIIPELALIGHELSTLADSSGKEGEYLIGRVEKIERVIDEIRSIASDQIPKRLSRDGLIETLHYYFQERDIDFENQEPAFEKELPLDLQAQLHVLRICQEVVFNLKKHAMYDFLYIRIARAGVFLRIELKHDGKGITTAEIERFTGASEGIGLKSIRTRLLVLRGSIEYFYSDDIPSIQINIPLP